MSFRTMRIFCDFFLASFGGTLLSTCRSQGQGQDLGWLYVINKAFCDDVNEGNKHNERNGQILEYFTSRCWCFLPSTFLIIDSFSDCIITAWLVVNLFCPLLILCLVRWLRLV